MASIGYGIIIAALMGLSAFGAAWVVLKLKNAPQWRTFKVMDNGDDKVVEEIKKGFTQFNIEEPPPTADAMARRFTKTHSQELRDATKGK